MIIKKFRYIIGFIFISGFFLLLNDSHISACGTCESYDYGPAQPGCLDADPDTPCPKWGIWYWEECGSDCGCTTDQCACANERHYCGDCPCTSGCSCSPSCPGGTSTNNTGPLCDRGRQSCSCVDGCGDWYSYQSDPHCYDPETNSNPATPTGLNMVFNSLTLPLSTNSSLRTLIMDPIGESVSMSMPSYSLSGARSILYAYRANNINNGSDWVNFTVTPLRAEDIIVENSSNTIPFNPALGAEAVLKPNYSGNLWVQNLSLDRCQDNWRWSTARNGYYIVSSLPTVSSITRTSANETLSTGVATGCGSATNDYVGRDLNNPVSFKVVYSDINHAIYHDMEALYVWFTNTTNGVMTPPTITNISSSGANQGTGPNTFGFMVRKENTTWSSVPNINNMIGSIGGEWNVGDDIYVSSNNSGTWSMVKVTDGVIRSADGSARLRISGVQAQRDVNNDMVLDFTAEFYTDDSDFNVSMINNGTYQVFGGASDHFSFLPFGGSSLRVQPLWNSRDTQLRVDLTKPSVSLTNPPSIVSSVRMAIGVTASDSGSGISTILGDSYRTGDLAEIVNVPISSVVTSGTGNDLYRDANGVTHIDQSDIVWSTIQLANQKYNSLPHLWNSLAPAHTVTVNIGENEGGGFIFYATTFDNACNYSDPGGSAVSSSPDIGSPWLMTKAGHFYTETGSQIPVRDFDDGVTGTYDFHTTDNPTINAAFNSRFSFKKEETQLGTELMTSSTAFINEFISQNSLNAFRVINYDHKLNQSDYWFDYLYDRYEVMKTRNPLDYFIVDPAAFLTFANSTGTKLVSSLSGQPQASFVVEYVGDLTIKSKLVCNDRLLVLVDGNLTLNPDITREDPINAGSKKPELLDGCIFLASGDITVAAGDRTSNTITYPSYDIIEGLLIADDQVNIPEVDTNPNDTVARDGLKVHGGVYGFGTNDNPGVYPGRSLKLANNMEYPAEVFHHDPRYLEIVKFLSEIGLKTEFMNY